MSKKSQFDRETFWFDAATTFWFDAATTLWFDAATTLSGLARSMLALLNFQNGGVRDGASLCKRTKGENFIWHSIRKRNKSLKVYRNY